MELPGNASWGGFDSQGKLRGYGIYCISFRFHHERVSKKSFRRHPYRGTVRGMFFGPDRTYCTRRTTQGSCRARFGGLGRYLDLTGLNPPLVTNRTMPRRPSTCQVQRSSTVVRGGEPGHQPDDVWRGRVGGWPSAADAPPPCVARRSGCVYCRRCFCSIPVTRSFDEAGRLRMTDIARG